MNRFFDIRIPHRVSVLTTLAVVWIGGSSATLQAQTTPWITGYFASQNGVLSASAIPWTKYTHVIHFAATTTGVGDVNPYYLSTDPNDPTSISAFVAAGHSAAKKVLLCIKDYDKNYNAFPSSTSATYLNSFVNAIVGFVTANGYDGVDLDWEKNVNNTQYEQLIAQLRSAFLQSALPAAIITIAGNPGTAAVAAASQNSLDQINVMCYDLDWGDNFSWYVDPLLRAGNNRVESCDWDVKQFTNAGVAPAKLGMGMPFYGRRWKGVTSALHHANFSNATTFLYRDLVNDATRWQPQYQFYDSTYKANYLSIPNPAEFDSYTGTQFITDAVAWAKAMGLGGYMAYSLDYEYLGAPYLNPNPGVIYQTGDSATPLSSALYGQVY